MNAGAMWVGELEGRIKELAEKAQGHARRLAPARLRRGALRRPALAKPDGDARRAAAAHRARRARDRRRDHPDRLERLLADRPRVSGAFEIIRVRPLDEDGTIAAAEDVLAKGARGLP